jgi:hypothetical protein
MFYGHADKAGAGFARWMLVDLRAFRAALVRHRKSIVRKEKPNYDGTYFCAFDVTSFPKAPPILVASSHEIFQAEAA